jgi:hypothetical protein
MKQAFYFTLVMTRCLTKDWKYFERASEEFGMGYVARHMWHTCGGVS